MELTEKEKRYIMFAISTINNKKIFDMQLMNLERYKNDINKIMENISLNTGLKKTDKKYIEEKENYIILQGLIEKGIVIK